jgi:peptidoglycan/xylan/chitin deacetylase (PgdA/CDA1 family)
MRPSDIPSRVLKLVISAVYWGIYWLLREIQRRIGKRLPGTCVVLYYHTITAEQRIRFAQQMDDVIRLAKPLSADTMQSLESFIHYVAITFDDGFQSVLENALPVLFQRKIPSTIFIPTGRMGHHPEWNLEPSNCDRYETVMTASQLRELPSDLVSIGSHAVTHLRLTSMGEDEAWKELHGSRQELESLLGQKIKLFSFPHGDYNEKLVELSRQAGYERVFGIVPTLTFLKPGEYVSGRVRVDPTDWRLEFKLKLLGAYRWLPLAFSLKRKILPVSQRLWSKHGVVEN